MISIALIAAVMVVGCGGAGQTTTGAGRVPPEGAIATQHVEAPRPPSARSTKESGQPAPACDVSKLLVWHGPSRGGVGLGTSYMQLDVTNFSDRACTISGIPRVVAVGMDGRRIGPPAMRNPGLFPKAVGERHLPPARLGREGTARFELAIGEVYNYGRNACGFKRAAGLGVTLPGSRSAQTVPMPIKRCPHKMVGGTQLLVGPIGEPSSR